VIELWQATRGEEDRVKAAEHLFDDPVSMQATARFLQHDGNHLVIAYVDGEPAGFVSGTEIVHPDQPQPELFLNELGVDPSYRGRGVARALVENLWQIARNGDCRGMWVLTDDENEAACKTYAAAGGSRVGAEVMFQWGET
jgi:[ribosomal protein S18]-alanine N-acetyltransferase